MDFQTAEKVLFQEVIDKFPTYGIQYLFSPSVADELSARGDQPFVSVELHPIAHRIASLGGVGNRVYRTEARLVFRLHILQNQGSRSAYQIIDNILEVFSGRNISGVYTRSADVSMSGSVGGWDVYTIEFPVYFDKEGV